MPPASPGSCFISVDVETSGPSPHAYSLLSIGACVAQDPGKRFYLELQPVGERFEPEALAVSGLSLTRLAAEGAPPDQAMRQFAAWVKEVTPDGTRPIFVGFNAPFDWMFVADYFHRFHGSNPFGHSALDIKALYMGLTGSDWTHTSLAQVAQTLDLGAGLPHHAGQDAVLQAAVFSRLLARGRATAETEAIHPATEE